MTTDLGLFRTIFDRMSIFKSLKINVLSPISRKSVESQYERGRQGLPLEDIYRQLFNRDLYLRAYGRLYRNDGAMTPGATAETVDGMSLAKIDAIIDDIRHERYRWTPVRRT